MQSSEIYFFLSFFAIVSILLTLDLGVFNKRDHVISMREAMAWTTVWVIFGLGWFTFLYFEGHRLHNIDSLERLQEITSLYGQDVTIVPGDLEKSLKHYRSVLSFEYLTGYLIEYSLSVDNIFVMILIFSAFKVEKRLYHRVLFWGILGAVIFRFIFIFLGAFLISRFSWIIYIFAVFLIYTGIKMFLARNTQEEINARHHPVVRWASKWFAVHPHFVGNHFFVTINKKNFITPLFLVLLIIEFTDIIFAVDSIPAIFAVTQDPYIVFFSNIFAILGLRSMFFLLINIIDKLRFFKHGLSALLIFIGGKMLLHDWLKGMGFTVLHSLMVILFILAVSIGLSILFPAKENK